MIFIRHDNATPTRANILYIHYFAEQLTKYEKIDGIVIDKLPNELPEIKGKIPVLFINPLTDELWYEYADIPKTSQEIIEELQYQNAQMLLALVNGGLI